MTPPRLCFEYYLKEKLIPHEPYAGSKAYIREGVLYPVNALAVGPIRPEVWCGLVLPELRRIQAEAVKYWTLYSCTIVVGETDYYWMVGFVSNVKVLIDPATNAPAHLKYGEKGRPTA